MMGIWRKSRRRLTLFYASVMCLFLIVLIFVVQKTMEWSLMSEQANELMDTAAKIADAQNYYNQHPDAQFDDTNFYKNVNERLFFYVFDYDGKLLNFSRASFRIEPFILDTISTWDVSDGDVKICGSPAENGREIRLMMTARIVYRPGNEPQTVYVGKDVTAMYYGLQKATYALIFLGIVALILASVAGFFMSGKAMIPLKEAYERQRQFAADASHELRTPLSVVMASAELLENAPGIEDPFLKQVIADVRDEVKKMTKLVSDLLIVARSDNKALQLKLSRFNLSEVLEQTARVMQPLAEKKHITLVVQETSDSDERPTAEKIDTAKISLNKGEHDVNKIFTEQTPTHGKKIIAINTPNISGHLPRQTIYADEQRIRQLVLILVDNAVKYTPDNGQVTVTLENDDDAAERDKIRFSVADTGIGISAENKERIFDRFYRVDKARSRAMGGNGLGLAIAREIVNLHNGSIDVESELQKGTKFTVEMSIAVNENNGEEGVL